MKCLDHTNLCFCLFASDFVLRGFIKRVINHFSLPDMGKALPLAPAPCSIITAEISLMGNIFFHLWHFKNEGNWKKTLVLDLCAVCLVTLTWTDESSTTISAHSQCWIFSSSNDCLISFSEIPPSQEAEPGLSWSTKSINCSACFTLPSWLSVFSTMQTPSKQYQDYIFPEIRELKSTDTVGMMNQVVCLCSFRNNAFVSNAPLEPSLHISIVLSMLMLSNTINASHRYIFLGAFICACLYLRGGGGWGVLWHLSWCSLCVRGSVCVCICAFSLYH